MRVLILILTLIALLAFPVDAQNEAVSVATDIVTLNVAVRDGDGKPVQNLTQGQFEVLDNGVAQSIEHFSHTSAGVTFGIVYDMHPTTADQTRAVLNGMRAFTKQLPHTDDFFLVVFNERGSLISDVIPDTEQLERHLATPTKREPRSLYDAILVAAAKLRSGKNLKRTLLVITDAADHNSRSNFDQLRSTLGELDVQVFGITPSEDVRELYEYKDLTTTTPPPTSDATPSERAALNSITTRSGGATFATALGREASVTKVMQEASDEMRNYYSLSFYPTAKPDGKWHTLSIRLRRSRGSKGFVLTYRTGYQSGRYRQGN